MRDKAFDVVTIGDCSIDTFLEIHEASLHAKLNRENSEFSFKYGDKIPIENLNFLTGGNAANTAVSFSRLGLSTAIITTIGADELSEKIGKTLKKEGVETRFIQKEAGTSSNFSVSINFQGERTLFTYHVKRDHKLGEVPQTSWIYLTSLGDYWQEVYEETAQLAKSQATKLAFAPGSHQLEGDPALLRGILASTTILFVDKQEAIEMANGKWQMGDRDNNQEMRELLVELQKLGPKIVSITDGINGSWAILEDGKILTLGISPCNIIETTGAGDAYSGGFLSAFILGLPVSTAMTWGAVNAASVIEKVGAQTGLLTKEEIEARLKENSEFIAREA